jgi:aminomethyltransferase
MSAAPESTVIDTVIIDSEIDGAVISETAEHYTRLRTTVGHYSASAGPVALTGLERGELLGRSLARDSEYVEPDTVRESLLLNADGTVGDAVTHLELDDASWLLPHSRTGLDLLLTATAEAAELSDIEITAMDGTHTATAFEGPRAWRIAEQLIDFEISSLVLHGAAPVNLPGSSAPAVLARIGSTGEYGYLLLAPVEAGAEQWVAEQAAALGGGPVGGAALARARMEVRHPQVPAQTDGLTVREAGLEWLVGWNREEEFHGSEALAELAGTEPVRSLITLIGTDGSTPAPGAEIRAAGTVIGRVHLVAPSVGTGTELALGLLDRPFDVPGLDLTTTAADGSSVQLRTAASPVVTPLSWTERLGA